MHYDLTEALDYLHSQAPAYTDVMHRYRTQSLFWELRQAGSTPHFTFSKNDMYKEDEHGNTQRYLSLYRIYMAIADPTEYGFAVAVFDSWEQWEKLCKNKLIMKKLGVEKWRTELEIKIRSMGINANIAATAEGNITSGKWLAEKKWGKKRTAGAPTKAEREQAMAIETALDKETEQELIRLGIH